MRRLILILAVICLSGCGSSDGGNDGGSSGSTTKAIISFTTVLENPQSQIFGSIEFTADLPEGVTVSADNNGIIDTNSLKLADKALTASTQLVLGTYAAPSNGLPAKVHISVITLNAVGNGTGISRSRLANTNHARFGQFS